MIRRLADRLVSVDLLDQGAELLQYQVDNRLQGAARAQVATRLAVIYLMNHKPDKAQAVLRATRTADLSNEIRVPRLMIEARALSDLGRHDFALEVVAGLEGRESLRLRSDIYWASRNWQKAAEHIELLYGDRWKSFEPLTDAERADMLRAGVGYALAEDKLGAARLRDKYAAKMAEGPDGRAFDVVTGGLGSSSPEFREVARLVASGDTLSGFLRDLKARYPEMQGVLPERGGARARTRRRPRPMPSRPARSGRRRRGGFRRAERLHQFLAFFLSKRAFIAIACRSMPCCASSAFSTFKTPAAGVPFVRSNCRFRISSSRSAPMLSATARTSRPCFFWISIATARFHMRRSNQSNRPMTPL